MADSGYKNIGRGRCVISTDSGRKLGSKTERRGCEAHINKPEHLAAPASGKRGVFEAEFTAEGECALLDLRGFSRVALRPQRPRPVVKCAGKRRPCLHLIKEPDRVLKVRERRRPVRRRLECEATATGPEHPRLAVAVVHATRGAQGLVPAGHAGGQISELRVA